MSTPVVANIIKSGAVIYYAPVGETIPDETTIDYGEAWGGNWKRVGYTKAPLTFAYTSEEFGVKVEEELGEVKRYRVDEALVIETQLAELTAEYLQLAASDQDTVNETPAAAAQRAYEETGLGGEVVLTEYAWGFEGLFVSASGDGWPVRVFVHKGTAMINGNLEFSKKGTDYVGIPIQIKALTDTTQSEGQKICLFQRVTADVVVGP